MSIEKLIQEIKFNNDGLVPVVTQEYKTDAVLMLAYMNKESFLKTIETGNATYWSRSRQKLWMKGESSGNVQKVVEMFIDCDGDTLLLKVRQLGDNGESEDGASCHLGYKSCFFRKNIDDSWQIISEPMFDPKEVYK